MAEKPRRTSKKGIAITAAIAAAIIAGSSIVWFLPQSNPGTVITPLAYEEILSEVFSKHGEVAASVDTKFDQWKSGQLGAEEMLAQVSDAEKTTADLRKQLVDARPTPQWQESYNAYTRALDAFSQYLGVMKQSVQSDDKMGADVELARLKQEYLSYVDQSINAMPVSA